MEVALEELARDYNRTAVTHWGRSATRTSRAFRRSPEFSNTFAKVYSDAGYQVVTTPGPDVLRVRTGVMNLSVTAPDTRPGELARTFRPTPARAAMRKPGIRGEWRRDGPRVPGGHDLRLVQVA